MQGGNGEVSMHWGYKSKNTNTTKHISLHLKEQCSILVCEQRTVNVSLITCMHCFNNCLQPF